MAEINIGGELVPKTMAKKVAKAEYVYDPNQGGKRQSEINAELYQELEGKADKSTTYTKTEVDNLVSPKANSADLATVATSGSYNDLSNKPTIPMPVDAYTKQESDAKYQPKGNYQPAGDYATEQQLAGKVDKIAGKGLSANDYTNEEKQKVADALVSADIVGKANKDEVYTKSETYNKTELNSMITTPDQGYVTVTATAQTTAVTDLLPATGAADTVYRVGCWDGSQYDDTCYSEYAWKGDAYVKLSTKNVGIDDEPTAKSEKLVKSGGVAEEFAIIKGGMMPKEFTWVDGRVNVLGQIVSSSASKFTQPFLLEAGETITCGTRNTNIGIINRVVDDSTLEVGDTVTPIEITSNTDQYEEYSYTATEDIYIVLCVLWGEHSETYIGNGYASKAVIDGIKSDISSLEHLEEDVKKITGGAISKDFVWYDGFVSNGGSIQASSQSKFTMPFLLKAGETVHCGTRNSNIGIISRAQNASRLYVGDTVDVIQLTSLTDQYEEYSYTANNDEYIVLCVKWSEHDESVTVDGYASEERIAAIENEVAKIERTYTDVSFKQGTKQVPTSDSNVYAELGKLSEGTLHIPSRRLFLIDIQAYSDSMYTNIVSEKSTDWSSEDIDVEVDTSLYYMVRMLYDYNIPDNPYEHNLHPSDVTWFTYSVISGETISEHVENLTERVDALENKDDSQEIPSYYKEHIDAKCEEIIAKDEQTGYNGDSFVFITDTHVEVNYNHSAQLIKYINDKCGTRLIFNGGDVIDSNCAKNDCRKYIRDWFSQYEGLRQYVALGNHDYNTAGQIRQDASYCLSSAELYADYIKRNEDAMVNPDRKNYYYVDNKIQKIRYYVLDVHYFQDLDYKGNNLEINNQLDWLEQTALEIGSEWTIVLFYHIYFVGSQRGAYGELSKAVRNPLAKRIVERVDTLIDNPNFPTVAAMITGHTHYDMYDLSAKGYPMIALDCDASYGYDAGGYDQYWSPQRAAETINEQSFNVIHIDKTNKKVLITRIGHQRSDHPLKTEFSYDPNVPNQPDYFPIEDA